MWLEDQRGWGLVWTVWLWLVETMGRHRVPSGCCCLSSEGWRVHTDPPPPPPRAARCGVCGGPPQQCPSQPDSPAGTLVSPASMSCQADIPLRCDGHAELGKCEGLTEPGPLKGDQLEKCRECREEGRGLPTWQSLPTPYHLRGWHSPRAGEGRQRAGTPSRGSEVML